MVTDIHITSPLLQVYSFQTCQKHFCRGFQFFAGQPRSVSACHQPYFFQFGKLFGFTFQQFELSLQILYILFYIFLLCG